MHACETKSGTRRGRHVAPTLLPARDLQLERKEEHAAHLGPQYHSPAAVALDFNVSIVSRAPADRTICPQVWW